jgi:SAM-dependent methyltransferase
MKEAFEKKYHEYETNHFWFKARRQYILQLLKNAPKNISILDIGCASGILLRELIEVGFDANNLYGIDISPKAIENCKANGIKNCSVMDAQHIVLNKKFDVIIASDCLEHIENDENALKNWHSLLLLGGSLYVFVPAFRILWSTHDDVNMHFRRYKKNELKRKLENNHFKITKSGYWNFFLFLPILLVRMLGKLNISKTQKTTGNLNKPTIFNSLFFNLINFENKLLKYVSFSFGVSTYCVAQKREHMEKIGK